MWFLWCLLKSPCFFVGVNLYLGMIDWRYRLKNFIFVKSPLGEDVHQSGYYIKLYGNNMALCYCGANNIGGSSTFCHMVRGIH